MKRSTPELYAAVQTSLGVAYQERLGVEPRASLYHSISLFEDALRYYSLQRTPLDYAIVQELIWGSAIVPLLKSKRE